MTQSPRSNCPVCGKRLLGDRNVRMHLKAVHSERQAAAAATPAAHPGDAGHPYGLEHPEPDHG